MIEPQQTGNGSPHRTRARPTSGSRLLRSPFLSSEERQAIGEAMSPPKRMVARTDLIREGERTGSLYVIEEGWACRFATTIDGGRQLPALLLPGDVCNLDSLMFERLDYGVRILSDAKVTALSRDRAMMLAAQHPGIARTFTWLAMVENTTLSRLAVSLGRRSARARVAHLLCELSVRLDAEQDGASCYGFPLTQEHIADALGLTPVHVNRTIRQLREDGLVEVDNRTVTLPDMGHLRRVGGFDQAYLHPPASFQFAQA